MFIWSLLVILTLIGIQNMIIMPIFMVQTLPFSALREAFGLSSGHSWACSPLLFFNFSVAKIFREESVSLILGARIVEGIVIADSKVVCLRSLPAIFLCGTCGRKKGIRRGSPR